MPSLPSPGSDDPHPPPRPRRCCDRSALAWVADGDGEAFLRALAGALTVREVREFIGWWVQANYLDAAGDATLICPTLTGVDAVIPIPAAKEPAAV